MFRSIGNMTSKKSPIHVTPQHRQALIFAEHIFYGKCVSHGTESGYATRSDKNTVWMQACQQPNPMVPENTSLVCDKFLRNGKAPQYPHDVHPTRTLKEMVGADPATMLLRSGLDQLPCEHGGALLKTTCTAFFAPYFSGR
jgi:hypothetical protein